MINRLSHVEIAVTDLLRARTFYCDALGFLEHAADADSIWLRAPDEFDVWTLKLTAGDEPGLLTFGFRVDREEALDELAELHAGLNLPLLWRKAGEEPGRGRTLRVRLASAHVVDFQHEIDEVDLIGEQGVQLPMRYTHLRHGVAPTRLDHINVRVTDMNRALEYWQGALGFSASELHVDDDGRTQRAWLRRTPFSHDLAIGRDKTAGFHHVAYAMRDSHALVRAADVLTDGGWPAIEYGPGRHGITDAHFLYIRDPDRNRVELYVGDYVRDLDRPPAIWRGDEYESRGLLWWGQQPPASFLHAGPLLDRGLVSPVDGNRPNRSAAVVTAKRKGG
jgi:catechol 2,3-dioxygenase